MKAGMGFAITNYFVKNLTELPRPVSDRDMTARLRMSRYIFATIISVCVPKKTNPDENKEVFNNQLASVFNGIPRTDNRLLVGDFNARIGRENDK